MASRQVESRESPRFNLPLPRRLTTSGTRTSDAVFWSWRARWYGNDGGRHQFEPAVSGTPALVFAASTRVVLVPNALWDGESIYRSVATHRSLEAAPCPGARCHRPNGSEAHYDRVLLAFDTLLTEDGEHPLVDLVERLIQRVTTYEDRAGHVPPAAPDLELRLIVQERSLTIRRLPRQSALTKG